MFIVVITYHWVFPNQWINVLFQNIVSMGFRMLGFILLQHFAQWIPKMSNAIQTYKESGWDKLTYHFKNIFFSCFQNSQAMPIFIWKSSMQLVILGFAPGFSFSWHPLLKKNFLLTLLCESISKKYLKLVFWGWVLL